jgi:hypothetical protein
MPLWCRSGWRVSVWIPRSRYALPASDEGGAYLSPYGNLRAVQLLLGHTKIESTVRYLGIEVDDAIEIAEKIDI